MTRALKAAATLASIVFALSACADRSLPDDASSDVKAPKIVVEAPERGTLLPGYETRVRGYVSDDDSGLDRVEVNGQLVPVGPDGRFDATVQVGEGLTLLHTRAYDRAGNEGRDTRSVLAGTFAPQDNNVANAVIARIDHNTLGVLGDIVENFVATNDLAMLAAGFNPVVDAGGSCLGAEVNVLEVDQSSLEVVIMPVDGGISVAVDIKDLFVGMVVDYSLACLDGDADIEISADRFQAMGTVEVGLVDGRITVDVADLVGSFENFALDVGIVPSSVIDLFIDDLGQKVADMLMGAIEDMVPPLAQSFLADFTSDTIDIEIFDRTVKFTIEPTQVDFTPQGGTITLEMNTNIEGLESPGYLVTEAPVPSAADMAAAGQGFHVGMADDVVNQALTAFWASGAMEQMIDIEHETGDTLLGGLINRVDLNMLLPPTISANTFTGATTITVGDLLLDVVNADGDVVTRMAVSGEFDVGVKLEDSQLKLSTTAPRLYLDVLSEGVTGANIFDNEQIEVLGSFVVTRVVSLTDDALGTIPIPTFASAILNMPTVEAKSGYMLLGGSLQVGSQQ
jgi:hypothetical protein